MTDWLALIEGRKAKELAEAVGVFLEFPVNPKNFLAECRLAAKGYESWQQYPLGKPCVVGQNWSEGTWRAWLKVRALAINSYRVEPCSDAQTRWTSCTLHVGFPWIEETEEHMENLRRSSEPIVDGGLARSKIGSTSRVITPVDRVAARVAPNYSRGES